MKKLSVFILALMISLMCFLPAFSLADTTYPNTSFTINNVNCVSESDALKYYKTAAKKESKTYTRVKVYHSAVGTSNSYTNLFHATKAANLNTTYGTLCGQKWCTPYLAVNITSNAIEAGKYYGLACRGNTKYNEYEGLTTFSVTGYYNPN